MLFFSSWWVPLLELHMHFLNLFLYESNLQTSFSLPSLNNFLSILSLVRSIVSPLQNHFSPPYLHHYTIHLYTTTNKPSRNSNHQPFSSPGSPLNVITFSISVFFFPKKFGVTPCVQNVPVVSFKVTLRYCRRSELQKRTSEGNILNSIFPLSFRFTFIFRKPLRYFHAPHPRGASLTLRTPADVTYFLLQRRETYGV